MLLAFKVIVYILAYLIPAIQLVRDWKYSDTTSHKYNWLTRMLILAYFIIVVPSAFFLWSDLRESSGTADKINTLVSGNNTLLSENGNLRSQISQFQNELLQRADEQANSQSKLVQKSEEIADLYKSLGKKSEENLQLNRSIELILHPRESTEGATINVIIDRSSSAMGTQLPAMFLQRHDVPASLPGARAAMDMTLLGIIEFIGWQEPDWQMDKLTTPSGFSKFTTLSGEKDCTVFKKDQIRDLLFGVENPFMSDFLIPSDVKLPPKSVFTIQKDPGSKEFPPPGYTICLGNPTCNMLLRLDWSGTTFNRPGSYDMPLMPDGTHMFESHIIFISIKTVINATGLAAHKYYDWTSRFRQSLRSWIASTETSHPIQIR